MLHHSEHPALYFSLIVFFKISLLNIFTSILRVKHMLGQTDIKTTCHFQKTKTKKCGSHLSGSYFACSVNNNVILNIQFSIS